MHVSRLFARAAHAARRARPAEPAGARHRRGPARRHPLVARRPDPRARSAATPPSPPRWREIYARQPRRDRRRPRPDPARPAAAPAPPTAIREERRCARSTRRSSRCERPCPGRQRPGHARARPASPARPARAPRPAGGPSGRRRPDRPSTCAAGSSSGRTATRRPRSRSSAATGRSPSCCAGPRPRVYVDLARRAQLVARAVGHRPGQGRVQSVRPQVLGVRTCFVAARRRRGQRARALRRALPRAGAIRFEVRDERWHLRGARVCLSSSAARNERLRGLRQVEQARDRACEVATGASKPR